MRRTLILLVLIVVGCTSIAPPTTDSGAPAAETQSSDTPDTSVEDSGIARDEIVVPIALYIVEDPEGSELSSRRTETELAEIAELMNDIWSQADITLDFVTIDTIVAPQNTLEALALGLNPDPFFSEVGRSFDVPNPGVINGFYVRQAGGVNGFAPSGSRTFFVVDEPSVFDQRVSSHEVGHLFGLHHQPQDPTTLMFSGTNGMTLTGDEQAVSRYIAQGVLNGLR